LYHLENRPQLSNKACPNTEKLGWDQRWGNAKVFVWGGKKGLRPRGRRNPRKPRRREKKERGKTRMPKGKTVSPADNAEKKKNTPASGWTMDKKAGASTEGNTHWGGTKKKRTIISGKTCFDDPANARRKFLRSPGEKTETRSAKSAEQKKQAAERKKPKKEENGKERKLTGELASKYLREVMRRKKKKNVRNLAENLKGGKLPSP